MSISRSLLVLTVAAAAALAIQPLSAEARGRGASRGERVRAGAQLHPVGSATLGGARLDVRRESLQNQTIRLRAAGAALTVFVADENGVLRAVGETRTRGRSGRSEWVVRTARGDALPFGVPDVAFLAGRAIELRTDAGQVVAAGILPQAARATGMPRKMKSLRQSLVLSDAAAAAGVEARIRIERHRGAAGLEIQIEGLPAGLVLEAWVRAADGTVAKLGDLVADGDDGDDDDESCDDGGSSGDHGPGAKSSRSDDDDDDEEDDDDSDEFDGTEYELELDASSVLPFGATSLAELAGLAVEIRDAADGSVIASGFLPDVSAPDADDDDGDDDDADDDDGDTDDDDGDDDDGDDDGDDDDGADSQDD